MLGFMREFNLLFAGYESTKAALCEIENKKADAKNTIENYTKQFFADMKNMKDSKKEYGPLEKAYHENILPYNKKLEKLARQNEYNAVKAEVYLRLLEIVAYNNMLAILKTECEKENSTILNTPAHYKKVSNFIESFFNTEKFYVYFTNLRYHTELSIRPKNDYYTEIKVSIWNIAENNTFSRSGIEKLQYKKFDFNVNEVTKNYIKFTQYAKKQSEKLYADLAQKRNTATYNGIFSGITPRDGIDRDLWRNVYLK